MSAYLIEKIRMSVKTNHNQLQTKYGILQYSQIIDCGKK